MDMRLSLAIRLNLNPTVVRIRIGSLSLQHRVTPYVSPLFPPHFQTFCAGRTSLGVSPDDRRSICDVLAAISEQLFSQSARVASYSLRQRRRITLSALGLERFAGRFSAKSERPFGVPFSLAASLWRWLTMN